MMNEMYHISRIDFHSTNLFVSYDDEDQRRKRLRVFCMRLFIFFFHEGSVVHAHQERDYN